MNYDYRLKMGTTKLLIPHTLGVVSAGVALFSLTTSSTMFGMFFDGLLLAAVAASPSSMTRSGRGEAAGGDTGGAIDIRGFRREFTTCAAGFLDLIM